VTLPGPYNNNLQIVQTRGYVMIFTEMIHDARVVPRRAPAQQVERALVDGRFARPLEGDTLVVDTINFTDRTNFRGSGKNLHSSNASRALMPTRSNTGSRWTIRRHGRSRGPSRIDRETDGRIYEFACHEGNYGWGILSGHVRGEGGRNADRKKK